MISKTLKIHTANTKTKVKSQEEGTMKMINRNIKE